MTRKRDMATVRRAREFLDRVSTSGGASRDELLRVFPLARELAEARGELPRYPTLRFFADWMLHPALDRRGARELLDRIADVIDRHKAGDPTELVRQISATLSLTALREELVTLFSASALPTFLFRVPEPWTTCASWLLEDLLEKPVVGSEFTEQERRTGWGETPRVLRLIADPQPGSDIKWCVELGPRAHLVGRLLKA